MSFSPYECKILNVIRVVKLKKARYRGGIVEVYFVGQEEDWSAYITKYTEYTSTETKFKP